MTLLEVTNVTAMMASIWLTIFASITSNAMVKMADIIVMSMLLAVNLKVDLSALVTMVGKATTEQSALILMNVPLATMIVIQNGPLVPTLTIPSHVIVTLDSQVMASAVQMLMSVE